MLELKNVTYQVTENNTSKNILDKMNLVIPDDKFIVITGPNGGGKSTLAKTIMGINPITEGQLIFDGQDITEKNITERAKLSSSQFILRALRLLICCVWQLALICLWPRPAIISLR